MNPVNNILGKEKVLQNKAHPEMMFFIHDILPNVVKVRDAKGEIYDIPKSNLHRWNVLEY